MSAAGLTHSYECGGRRTDGRRRRTDGGKCIPIKEFFMSAEDGGRMDGGGGRTEESAFP
jgi:hypothetical protein